MGSQHHGHAARTFLAGVALGSRSVAAAMLIPTWQSWKSARAELHAAQIGRPRPLGPALKIVELQTRQADRALLADTHIWAEGNEPPGQVTFTRRKPATVSPNSGQKRQP